MEAATLMETETLIEDVLNGDDLDGVSLAGGMEHVLDCGGPKGGNLCAPQSCSVASTPETQVPSKMTSYMYQAMI